MVNCLLLTVTLLGLLMTAVDSRKCLRKYAALEGHTGCIAKSPDVISSGLAVKDKQVILDEHNRYRKNVKPPACNMLKLSWDEDLAYVAQKWADNCDFNHDKQRRIPGKFSAGQNLAYGYSNWKSAIKGWHDEVKDFTFGGANSFGAVGHYTQMVWAKTFKIGCGFANCKKLRGYYVCNYGPAGNIGDKKYTPYRECNGRPTIYDCPPCYNGGTINAKNCKCTCPRKSYIKGPNCRMECGKTKDPVNCEYYSVENCRTYSNIPDMCPWKCSICPNADSKDEYVEYSNDENNEYGGGKRRGNDGSSLYSILNTMFSLLGMFGISASYCIIWLYTPEVYPTKLRNIGLSFLTLSGNIGNMLSPFSRVLKEYIPWLPGTICGTGCMASVVLLYFMPESKRMQMPATMMDVRAQMRLEKGSKYKQTNEQGRVLH